GRAAAHPAGGGYALGDVQSDAGVGAGGVGEQLRRTPRQVGAVRGHLRGVPAGDRHGDVGGRLGHDVLVQAHGLEHGRQRVVAVRAGRADAQRDVDLARRAHVHGGRRVAHASLPASAAAAAAIAANAVMSRRSPRSVGSMPAARSTRSARSADPAHPARAARSVLRRCANAASTTANVASRVAVVVGGCRRSSRTSAESTFGTGQNTDRPTDPARRASAYQAAFADGTPYVREPGGATSRSATSACTMTSADVTDGSTCSTCSSTGTATL